MEIVSDISMDPNIRFGKPCLTEARTDVPIILGTLSADETFEAIQGAYAITHKQILAALRYAVRAAEHLPSAVVQTS